MKLLHCIDSINPAFGGPVEAVKQFAALSKSFGHTIDVLTLDEGTPQWQASWPITVKSLPGSFSSYGYNHRLIPWLREHRREYDAVIAHGLWKFHTVGVARALRGTDTPYFVIPHGMLNPWLKNTYPAKHLKKVFFWHTVVRQALRDAAAALFLCEEEPALANKTFDLTGISQEIVPLGIAAPIRTETESSEFLTRFPELRGRRTFLFLGRICLMKGCDILLRAFAQSIQNHPECALVIAGPDETGWQTKLMALAKSLDIEDRVVWAGPLYGNMKRGALAYSDTFVLPSHCETFPVAVLEALAYGKPVLITDKINIWREIERGGAGIIGADTEPGVAASLKQWLQLTEKEKKRYRENALRCFRTRFEIGAAFKAHIELYGKYVNTNRRELVGHAQVI